MNCPHCATDDTQTLNTATDLGYSRFRCRQCRRRFNERTGTLFNRLELPTEIVFQIAVFRLLFKLSLRDLVRMFLIRGYDFTYETVRAGLATQAYFNGAGEFAIRRQTGDRSLELVRRYIRDGSLFRENPAAKLGL